MVGRFSKKHVLPAANLSYPFPQAGHLANLAKFTHSLIFFFWTPTSSCVQGALGPGALGSKGPWVQGPMCPRALRSKGPCVQGPMGPRAHGSKGLWVQGSDGRPHQRHNWQCFLLRRPKKHTVRTTFGQLLNEFGTCFRQLLDNF